MNKNEFVPYAPDVRGEQVRVDHDGCSAGTDTKRRLYIKRLTDGTVLAYCHNCGESGYYRYKVRNINYLLRKPTVVTHPKDIRMPSDSILDTSLWPKEALSWLYQYGITSEEIKERGIAYSPSYGRVCFPLYMDGEYIGWQGRSLDESTNPPKYLTMVDRSRAGGNAAEFGSVLNGNTLRDSRVVIVEDCLSAIKISRLLPAVCTLGTHPTDEVSNWLSKRYQSAVIWYDNDKPEVKKAQADLFRLLGTLTGGKAVLILTDKDPKEYSNEEIKCLLKP